MRRPSPPPAPANPCRRTSPAPNSPNPCYGASLLVGVGRGASGGVTTLRRGCLWLTETASTGGQPSEKVQDFIPGSGIAHGPLKPNPVCFLQSD